MRRVLNALGLAACAGLLGYAYYAQFYLGLNPCPLCIFQRIGVIAIGVLFLLAMIHNPGAWGARAYGVLLLLAASITMAVAARHLWIMHQPEGSVPACGAALSYMLQIFPLTEVIRRVLTGSGECAKIGWTFLGLSMPGWVLLAAAGLGLYGLYVNRPNPVLTRAKGAL
jgi:disulfide bond formation protein DsbB